MDNGLDDAVHQCASDICGQKFITIRGKLLHLHEAKCAATKKITPPPTDFHVFHPRILNISNYQISEEEYSLLAKELKFAILHIPKSKDLETFSLDCEIVLQRDNLLSKQLVEDSIIYSTSELNARPKLAPNLQWICTTRYIQKSLKSENIIIQKADKETCVVVMNKSEHIAKCLDFIGSEEIECVPCDPSPAYQSKIREVLCHVTNINSRENYKYIVMNPIAPRFYGFLKIHKPDTPIRPVVSCINSPSSSKLNVLVKDLSNFSPKFSIKNSLELPEKIKFLNIPKNAILVSFDVTNLFTSVPCQHNKAIDITIKLLGDANLMDVMSFPFIGNRAILTPPSIVILFTPSPISWQPITAWSISYYSFLVNKLRKVSKEMLGKWGLSFEHHQGMRICDCQKKTNKKERETVPVPKTSGNVSEGTLLWNSVLYNQTHKQTKADRGTKLWVVGLDASDTSRNNTGNASVTQLGSEKADKPLKLSDLVQRLLVLSALHAALTGTTFRMTLIPLTPSVTYSIISVPAVSVSSTPDFVIG
ncbi:hypothetical protein J437_LFUL006016 [Ladona fulva]|uniref:Reverse transcriptase domain-containing protein n=1 Tax=Ladona fulva TaxID=123851 RepID=A0A8K0NUE6_LADFU|nr:hypothetical protein J437_LFUL006016 [Ladona fulva]